MTFILLDQQVLKFGVKGQAFNCGIVLLSSLRYKLFDFLIFDQNILHMNKQGVIAILREIHLLFLKEIGQALIAIDQAKHRDEASDDDQKRDLQEVLWNREQNLTV